VELCATKGVFKNLHRGNLVLPAEASAKAGEVTEGHGENRTFLLFQMFPECKKFN